MIILTNDFEVASAAYGIIKHSDLKEAFFFESNDPLIKAFNYLKESPDGKTFNLKGIKSPKYNQICWWEIVEEARKHMETITPDPNVNFGINQKVKAYFSRKYPKNLFQTCNDIPDFRSEEANNIDHDFILTSDPDTDKYIESLRIWGFNKTPAMLVEKASPTAISLAQHKRCKALIGSANDWLGVVSTSGYIKIEDLKHQKPFFFPEQNCPFQQTPLSISITYPLDYIKFRKELYDNMVKYNFDHIAYLRDKYGTKKKGI